MESRDISRIYDDSTVSADITEDFARLGSLSSNSWISGCIAIVRPYLQIGLVAINNKLITAIATAVTSNEHTWSYYLSYTQEGHIWTDYTENGVLKVESFLPRTLVLFFHAKPLYSQEYPSLLDIRDHLA